VIPRDHFKTEIKTAWRKHMAKKLTVKGLTEENRILREELAACKDNLKAAERAQGSHKRPRPWKNPHGKHGSETS
jgi:hypothetical protein